VLARVEFLQDDPDRIRLRVNAPCDGFVILADEYYKGWRATVNGSTASIYRANYAFRAVEVGTGNHEIMLSYDPWSLRLGIPIALLTVLGVISGLSYRAYSSWRGLKSC
jgi:uncharacterized membrane protein YfhO